MDVSPGEFQTLGLYDPSSEDAEDRLALLQFLADHGVEISEMQEADKDGRLHVLAVEGLLRPRTRRMTLQEAADQLRVSPEMCLRIWRALGFVDPDLDEEVFSESDVEMMGLLPTAMRLGIDIDELLHAGRIIGSSMARIAEAEVALLRANVEAPLRAAGAGDFVVARTLAGLVGEVLPRISTLIEGVHRQHLDIAARSQVLMDIEGGYDTADVTIGFADLMDFTAWSEKMAPSELSSAIASYEERVSDTVVAGGGRIVKFIGDGVMFAADELEAGCEVALRLIESFNWDPVLPPMRIGVAAGEAIKREGDYYGPVVNLASRIVDVALPRSVLVSKDVADRLDSSVGDDELPSYLTKRVGAHKLKGIGSVQLYVLRRERRSRQRD